MCATEEDPLSSLEISLRAIVFIYIMLEQIVKKKSMMILDEGMEYSPPDGDFKLRRGSEKGNLHSLIFDLVSPSPSGRNSLIEKNMQNLMVANYDAMNIETGNQRTLKREVPRE